MKKIALFLILMLSTTAMGISFKKKDNFTKLKTGDKEYTYMDISALPIVFDADSLTAYIGYHKLAPKPDEKGQLNMIFIPLKEFQFEDLKLFQNWISTVRPYENCLTMEGKVSCE